MDFRWSGVAVKFWLVCATLFIHCSALSDHARLPLNRPDMNPFTLGYVTADTTIGTGIAQGQWRWQMGLNVANTVQSESRADGSESILLDAETKRFHVGVEYGLSDKWTLSLDLPYIRHSAGHLDGAVDEFHGLFGFPEGPRGKRPPDLLAIEYRVDGHALVDFSQPSSGIGDIGLSVIRSIDSDWIEDLRVGAKLKFPSGDYRQLTGSGTVDGALWLSGTAALATNVSQFFSVGAAVIEKNAGLLNDIRNSKYGFLSYGVAWRYNDFLTLKAQLDTRSAIYHQTSMAPLKASTTISFGGTLTIFRDYQLDIAVVEDIHVGTAPDVVFHINLFSAALF